MREIAFDTETTGLDPFSGHRIVEIGCVEMVDKIRTGCSFQRYLNPERDVPEEAQRVHGLSSKFLQDKPLFSQVVEEFLAFIGDSQLVIHNAAFDMKFLNHELERLGFKPLPMTRATDTVVMARRKFPGAGASLDALCKRFNIDLAARDKHGALLDAELLADVYLELHGGRQGSIQLLTETARVAMQPGGLPALAGAPIPAREFPLSLQEQAAHQGFITKLKNSLWAKLLESA